MKETLQVINEMQKAGVIGKYAIGGAVGATFYLEAVSTFDIDIFIPFENKGDSQIVSLNHLYNYLLPRGFKPSGAHFVIHEWQVQFLPASDDLYAEALDQALETDVEGVKTWVMKAEHLMAICLRTGRTKDFSRLEQFVERMAPVTASAAAPLRSAASIVGSPSRPVNQTVTLNPDTVKVYDEQRLHEILERHGLLQKWNQFNLQRNAT